MNVLLVILLIIMSLMSDSSVCLCCRVTMHPFASGAQSPPGLHAGAERPGHVCQHPHQHALPYQEGGKQHSSEYYSDN